MVKFIVGFCLGVIMMGLMGCVSPRRITRLENRVTNINFDRVVKDSFLQSQIDNLRELILGRNKK